MGHSYNVTLSHNNKEYKLKNTMSQPIITTDISAVRPVFSEGAAENIKRFSQLKKMFADGREYAVLAEPVADGKDKITWHTEFDGTPEPYSKLTEEEQELAKGRIKYQVNRLFKSAFKQLYHGNMKDVEDLFNILDSCIEIPDYNNIYRVTDVSGKTNYVLIKWGFTSDDFKAQTGLIKKLVPLKVDTIRLKLIKNKKPFAGEQVCLEYKKKVQHLTTDSYGYVELADIPLGDKFYAWASSDKSTLTEYLCDGSDEYHLLIGTQSTDMVFSVLDQNSNPLADTEITFTYDGKTYFETTDANGRITLHNIAEGTEITVVQKNSRQKFVCNPTTVDYVFHGTRPASEIEVSVTDDSGLPVKSAKVTFEYQGNVVELDTDRGGRASVDNMPVDIEFAINCKLDGYNSAKTRLFTHEGINLVELKLRKISQAGKMVISVVDEGGNPIENTLIRCENDDTKTEIYTDEEGKIILDKINFGSEVICTQVINGLASHRHTFLFSEGQSKYVLKGKKILTKSGMTLLEIHVINKKKQDIPNLRISIDDGHNVINRITNSEGRIVLPEMERGKKQTISTEYRGQNTELEYTCSQESELLTITVGRSPLGFLFWLIPLILAGLFCIWKFLIPAVQDYIENRPVVVADTTQNEPNNNELTPITETDTLGSTPVVEPVVEVPKEGLTITVIDENGKNVSGAKIELKYGAEKLNGTTDGDGKFSFDKVPVDSTLQITANVKSSDGKKEYLGTFYYTPEKIISISTLSQEISDEILPCGQTIKSKGYHSTIKTFDVKKAKGTLKILYDMFDIPDEMIVYSGPASKIDDSKIIYKTGKVKGPYKTAKFSYDTPDGIITVRINGGDNSKTQWYFKVYCP